MERLDSLSPDELIQIILDQQQLIEQLRAEIEQLKRRGSAAPAGQPMVIEVEFVSANKVVTNSLSVNRSTTAY